MKYITGNHGNICCGAFNVRGCNKSEQKLTLLEDMISYDLDILGITETHIPQHITVENLNKDKHQFVLFSVNNEGDTNHGVGFIIKKNINPTFKKITDRICKQVDRSNQFDLPKETSALNGGWNHCTHGSDGNTTNSWGTLFPRLQFQELLFTELIPN